MALSARAKKFASEIMDGKLGGLKKRAKEIERDQDLAPELWAAGECFPRLPSVLILNPCAAG